VTLLYILAPSTILFPRSPAMPTNAPSVRSTEHLNAQIPGAFPDARSPSIASISTHQTSLTQTLYDRRSEYTRQRNVRLKIGTWNTAAQKGTEQDIGAWFVQGKGVEEAMAGLGVDQREYHSDADRESEGAQEARHARNTPTIPHHDPGSGPRGEEVDIYVLGLQEIVDISSATEALRPYTDPSVANRWKASLEAALPKGYKLVSEQQLIGLWLVIYASPQVFPQIKNVSTTSVGTGLMGYMGNKGAVTTRIVLGETTRLVFINSHLAAGADKASLDRRNWDTAQINTRTRFDPIIDSLGTSQSQGEGLGDEEFAFWFGDLNYRLEGMPGDDVRRLLTIHTKDLNHDSEGRPSTSGDSGYASKASSDEDRIPMPPELDPASLQTTVASLLPHDELHQQMKKGKAFHDGWQEGPIRFLPSYKYDVGTVGVFDSSEKRRCPSWCDRILYRTRAAKQQYDTKVKEQGEARKKDEEMRAKGMDLAGDDDILFDYNPDTDGDNAATYDEYEDDENPEPEPITTKDGLSDEILLEYYTTHMRVLSSDHKPLDAAFSLKYDAVVPELKAAIHGEVARELDRQENEGRPSIAVVIDRATGSSTTDDQDKTDSNYEGVDFGDVKFAKSKKRAITIANTGRVPATFGFADRPVDQDQAAGPFPAWLSVSFDREPDKRDRPGPDDVHERYTLEPAEVINAELKLKVESLSAVRSFNEGAATLEEVLVLRVEHGRDHFLPLRAHWLPSALARTVDKLIKIPEGGIRKLQNQIPDRGEVKWSVPREVFRLTEAIEDMTERTLAEWDMTKGERERAPFKDNAGWPFARIHTASHDRREDHGEELADLYDALDCDTPFAKAFKPETRSKEKVEILAAVLLTFLSSLTDGIITKSLWEKLEEGLITREKAKQHLAPDDEKMWVLEILATAPSHNASFLLLLSFLQNVTNQVTDASKPTPETPRTSVDLPASPKVKVRRRTLSKVPEIAIRQLVIRNYAVVFSDAIFRSKEEAMMKEKDKATRKERMVKVVELFLSTGDD
jgi:phosphatidylinositol-bisphosphatase